MIFFWSDGQTTVCGQTNERKRGATLLSFGRWKSRMPMGIYLVARNSQRLSRINLAHSPPFNQMGAKSQGCKPRLLGQGGLSKGLKPQFWHHTRLVFCLGTRDKKVCVQLGKIPRMEELRSNTQYLNIIHIPENYGPK